MLVFRVILAKFLYLKRNQARLRPGTIIVWSKCIAEARFSYFDSATLRCWACGFNPHSLHQQGRLDMTHTCSQCEQQIAGANAITVKMGNDLYVFCHTRCKHQKFYPAHPELGSWLKTSARKNLFCRRSGKDRRSGRERRISIDSSKYHVDRRGKGDDRRKGRDRRKHDYWNTAGKWPETGLAMPLPSLYLYLLRSMKEVAIFILWGILVLFLINFSATILETVLSFKVDYRAINLICILALVALHYFKFRKA